MSILDPHTKLPVEQLPALTELKIATVFDPQTGRGFVKIKIPGTELAYTMLPAEARLFGLRLISECEKAMADATFLRAMLEFGEMPLADAVLFCKRLSDATRADHAMVYEQMCKASLEQQAMDKEPPNGNPS